MIFMGGGDPAGMMMGMAVGSVVGKHMANTMNNAMDNMQLNVTQQNAAGTAAPPPVPAVRYNVAIDGQTTGPFDMNTLAQMVQSGKLTPQTLVWKQGMSGWAAAETVIDMRTLFSHIAPAAPAGSPSSPNPQVYHKESTVHIYNERDFYSMDRLIEFGMSTNIAQQMVNNMNHHMKNMFIPGAGNPMMPPQQQQQQFATMQTPPPHNETQEIQIIPEPIYYAMIDGKQSGPYCETELARLINDKKVAKETYIWYTGINEWVRAENIPTILRLVALVPPPPPLEALGPPPPPVEA